VVLSTEDYGCNPRVVAIDKGQKSSMSHTFVYLRGDGTVRKVEKRNKGKRKNYRL